MVMDGVLWVCARSSTCVSRRLAQWLVSVQHFLALLASSRQARQSTVTSAQTQRVAGRPMPDIPVRHLLVVNGKGEEAGEQVSGPSPRPAVPQCVCPVGRVGMRASRACWTLFWCHRAPWVPFPLSHTCAALCACWSAHQLAGLKSFHVTPRYPPSLQLPCSALAAPRAGTTLFSGLLRPRLTSDVSSLLSLLHPWCPVSSAWRPPPRGGL